MSIRNNSQRRNEQKPTIEDVIRTTLSEGRQEVALEFVSFLRALRMSPQWASTNSWAVTYKSKRVCYIKIADKLPVGTWYIRPSLQYDDALNDFCVAEDMVSLMLKSVHFCKACGKCAPGKTVSFFGQELDHVCCAPIDFEFHNPSSNELECVKKLVIYSRQKIQDMIHR